MRSTDVNSLTGYLLEIAPQFFTESMKPATEAEIDALAKAAGRSLPSYHRELLRVLGRTQTDALNPFLNGRGFSIAELLSGYADLAEYGTQMPPQISLFSTSESFSEFLFLKQSDADIGASPALGSLDLDSGEFVPHHIGTLAHYLVAFTFAFRLAQFDHLYSFSPRSHMKPEPALAVLHQMGLRPVFEIPQGRLCLEGNQFAAVVHSDGSGQVACEDPRALLDLCELLAEHADSETQPTPSRLVAPKR